MHVILPLGLFIALLVYQRKRDQKPNLPLKRIALIFGGLFYLLSWAIPAIPLADLLQSKRELAFLRQFNGVEATYSYQKNAALNQKIQADTYDPQTGYNEAVMGVYWICLEEGIAVKSREWLWFDAHTDAGIDWTFARKNDRESHVLAKLGNGHQYALVFRRENDADAPYLSYAIEHKGEKSGAFSWKMN